MTNLEDYCDNFYVQLANSPGISPLEYPIWFGGHSNDSSYRVLVNKDKINRKDSWKNFLTNYFKFPELALSKDNNFETSVWNNFFCSGYKIVDNENNRMITAYTPWWSFILRPFLGGDIIITKVKENYQQIPQLESKPIFQNNSQYSSAQV